MKKLWTEKKIPTDPLVDQYCFSEGIKLDNALVIYDVYGSIAHAAMLKKIGIINSLEFKNLKKTLIQIIDLYKNGGFIVEQGDEDVHTKIEGYLTDKLGELGKKIHTARSRNDQVLVDLRLYTKKQLQQIVNHLIDTSSEFLSFAKKYEFIPMPGYTHMQKAMPSSVGMWAASFVEQLTDLITIIKSIYDLNDQSPLGSGAAYGVSLPIDRSFTAEKLGFSKVQNNSLYCQISRPIFHLAVIQFLVQVMLAASRFASDLLLFTTAEFDLFTVDESICTGSSIMPQKKNLDAMEYVRAKTNAVISYEMKIAAITAGLPSGYNGDFGETKGPLMESFSIVIKTLQLLAITVKATKPNTKKLIESCTPEVYTTHLVYEKVMKGVPFRAAYMEIKKSSETISKPDSVSFIKKSKHLGGTGNLNLKELETKLAKNKKEWKKVSKDYKKIISLLLSK